MRLVAMGLLPLVLAGCGAKYKPTGPVMGEFERALQNPVQKRLELSYAGRRPATNAPVVPVLAFGAAFDLDVAVMAKKDEAFDMVEFARMNVPWGDGYVWMALETSPESGDQTLVADLDELPTFMPEIPLARRVAKMTIEDRVTPSTVDFELSYEGSEGPVHAVVNGDAPLKGLTKRNGNTFTHSQNQLLAVLDVSSAENLFKANVEVDGRNLGIRKIGGIVPGQFALAQVQGGFAVGNYRIVPTGPAVGGADLSDVVYHAPGSNEPPVAKSPPDMRARVSMATGFPMVKLCWESRVAGFQPSEAEPKLLGGQLAWSWTVTRGVVSDVAPKPIEGSTFADATLATCVGEAIAAWHYDDDVSAKSSWKFTFTPPDVEAGADAFAKGEPEDITYEAFDPTALTTGPDVVRPEVVGPDGAPDPAAPAPAPGEAQPAEAPAPEELPDEELTDGAGAPAANPAAEEVLPLDLSSFTSVHTQPDGSTVEMPWLVVRTGETVTASQTSDLRTLTYTYHVASGTYLELQSITVEQYGRATPVTSVTFSPALPDFRWAFQGAHESNFVIDVNGQRSFGAGTVVASWTDTGPKLLVKPSAPSWAASRPMVTQVIYLADGTFEVRTQRIDSSE